MDGQNSRLKDLRSTMPKDVFFLLLHHLEGSVGNALWIIANLSMAFGVDRNNQGGESNIQAGDDGA